MIVAKPYIICNCVKNFSEFSFRFQRILKITRKNQVQKFKDF